MLNLPAGRALSFKKRLELHVVSLSNKIDELNPPVGHVFFQSTMTTQGHAAEKNSIT